jgi:hypothetical protein
MGSPLGLHPVFGNSNVTKESFTFHPTKCLQTSMWEASYSSCSFIWLGFGKIPRPKKTVPGSIRSQQALFASSTPATPPASLQGKEQSCSYPGILLSTQSGKSLTTSCLIVPLLSHYGQCPTLSSELRKPKCSSKTPACRPGCLGTLF